MTQTINSPIFVNANAEDGVRFQLLGTVGGSDWFDIRAEEVIDLLRFHENDNIFIDLFSFGGNAFHALAIHDYIVAKGINAEVNLFGFCGSAATVIACAGKKVNIGSNSFFFIHNAYNGFSGEEDNDTQKVTNQLIEVYKKRTGLNRRKIKAFMIEETMFNAKEAKEFGFVDSIISDKNVVAEAFNKGTILNDYQTNKSKDKNMDFNILNWVKSFFGEAAKDIESEDQAKAFLAKQESLPPSEIPDFSEQIKAEVDEQTKALQKDFEAKLAEFKKSITGAFEGELEKLTSHVVDLAKVVAEKTKTVAKKEEEMEKKEDKFGKLADEINALKSIPSGDQPKVEKTKIKAEKKEEEPEKGVVIAKSSQELIDDVFNVK